MSHQPFETWILDPQTVRPEDRRALQEHLETCPQCQRMRGRWQAVHQELRARRMASPAPGFTQRWQASLADRRAQEQRKQAWKVFGIFVATALILFLALAIYSLTTATPTDWLVAVIRTLSSTRDLMQIGLYVIQTWLTSTPLVINIAIWIYLTVTLCALSLFWLLILWRTHSVGVLNS